MKMMMMMTMRNILCKKPVDTAHLFFIKASSSS